MSLFKNEKLDDIPAYIETGINLGLLLNKKPETLGKIIGVRTNSFKYWRARKNPQEECYLFDLENDPNEEKNISKDNPKIISEMEEHLTKWKNKTDKTNSNKELSKDEIEKATRLYLTTIFFLKQ